MQVITLDGKAVWRRRHYRVRRAEVPGTFHFSVLDNGVISKEFWRIVHVTEDLSWGLFYYAGAASVVGQAYRGQAIHVQLQVSVSGSAHILQCERQLQTFLWFMTLCSVAFCCWSHMPACCMHATMLMLQAGVCCS